jgi:hypothetical protein
VLYSVVYCSTNSSSYTTDKPLIVRCIVASSLLVTFPYIPRVNMEVQVCQHHLKGKCTRGDKCRFSHAKPEPIAPSPSPAGEAKAGNMKICEHFLNNKCTRGEKCRFSHAVPKKEKPMKQKKSKATCNHYINGSCTRGDQCRFVHPEGQEGSSSNRKRTGLQGRHKRKDWLRYGAKLDNVMSVVKVSVGCVHLDAPLCKHQAKCAKRKVDKPSARRYGKEYWCCHKVVTGQSQDNCGFFKWVEDAQTEADVEREKKRRKFEEEEDGEESSSSSSSNESDNESDNDGKEEEEDGEEEDGEEEDGEEEDGEEEDGEEEDLKKVENEKDDKDEYVF